MLHIYSGKTNEEIKQDVLTSLYQTGRYNKLYFGRTAKVKINPLKLYIERFLKINKIHLDGNELCDECYQTAFYFLSRKPAEWFIEILNESPNGSKLIATTCFIIKTQCFAVKANPKYSGLIFNILNISSYGNIPVSTSEILNDDSNDNSGGIIIYDEDEPDEFESQYNVDIENLIDELAPEEQSLFYMIIDKKSKRGKPTKQIQEDKQVLYQKLLELKRIKHDKSKLNPNKLIDESMKKYKSDAEIDEELKNLYN